MGHFVVVVEYFLWKNNSIIMGHSHIWVSQMMNTNLSGNEVIIDLLIFPFRLFCVDTNVVDGEPLVHESTVVNEGLPIHGIG